LTAHHNIFRSCNREQTLTARSRSLSTDPSTSAPYKQGWCAQCPKCIFTFLCLHCFLPREELESIFGVDPSTMPHFESLVYELAGLSSHKPFECVGTYQEVRVCIAHLYKRKDCSPSLARICGDIQQQDACARTPSLVTLLAEWHDNHFLSIPQTSLLRSALEKLKTDTLLS
jgi:hypothetical protein